MINQTSIWITGAEGRLGQALCKEYANNTDFRLVTSDTDVPVEDLEEVLRFANVARPDVIINCAGLTDNAKCEKDPDMAYTVNALGARNLAIAARRLDVKLIQLSTDDVFGGQGTHALNEFDVPTPTTVYGKSKYAGEKLVESLTDKHVIVRSSWNYGVATKDFVDRILDHAKANQSVELPFDEFSTPTSANALAGFVEKLVESDEYGIFHASCEGGCSRADWAREILRTCGYANIAVHTQVSETHQPRFTLLDNMMMRITGVYAMPEWKAELHAYLKENGYVKE
ncbi:MAG: NAD(P)-dependent oxidoreductase [Absicoccus porci]|uniref:SDR family oxidoreductase n=1 Tax=Absicoccus porci TaxID=2486576 RepID=UPI002409CDEC|nr:NAD(P)-dependent oxidoreductase [Absicoccus porci]MDD6460853.1 NAD(P)-dependent oxidoreductase [Absicoccus porci]MEE1355189.1 NAD(P)-dependent oxidoreductase [Absicoccus porci]